MNDGSPNSDLPRELPGGGIAQQASAWLARRDRGLSPREQDEYLQWLREDPRHGAALAHLLKTWGALDTLEEQRPAHGGLPNPDLLAPPRAPASALAGRRRLMSWVLLAAAAIAMGGFVAIRSYSPSRMAPLAGEATNGVRVHHISASDPTILDDGSRVVPNGDSIFDVRFAATERRVRLVRGEVHFTVAKNPARPFVVEVGKISVRAVGTAFGVVLADDGVKVLVTEGKVQVEERAASFARTLVVAGERASFDTSTPVAAPVVEALASAEIERLLAWMHARIQFADLPLRDVVAEFNLRNRQQLRIDDVETGQMLVGGSFRADNVDAFVRLLELSFGVTAERRDDGTTVLRRAK